MEIFADGRIYLSKGERFPLVCPSCEHIMVFREDKGLITCEKCDEQGTVEDFNRAQWTLTKVN